MLTGVVPNRHGVTWNGDLPAGQHIYPRFPTLFELAHKQGLTTAMAAGKSKFSALNKPGTIDWCWIAPKKGTDADVAAHAVEFIAQHQPQVLFVHLPGVDSAGHAKGWGGEAQMAAIAAADKAVGQVLAALDEAKLTDSTFVLVSADHGGAGRTHGANDPRSRHIPWIVRGPGIRQDYDLTLDAKLVINTEDTFATACWLLGIPPEPGIDGKPIKEILARQEQPVPAP
jgi:arylsulfatase A-like enzyme